MTGFELFISLFLGVLFLIVTIGTIVKVRKENRNKSEINCEECSGINTLYKSVRYSEDSSCVYRFCSSCKHIKIYSGYYRSPKIDASLVCLLTFVIYSDNTFSEIEENKLKRVFDIEIAYLYAQKVKECEDEEIDVRQIASEISLVR